MRATFLAALLACLPPLAAAAQEMAAPRPFSVVEEPVLRLGDVFENAGERAAQAIGAAPAPGRRLVLDAAQLSALARAPLLPPVGPPAAVAHLSAENTTLDAATGRFSATLVVLAEGMPTLRVRL